MAALVTPAFRVYERFDGRALHAHEPAETGSRGTMCSMESVGVA